MAVRPNVKPLWQESFFKDEGLDARALITRTDLKGIITFASPAYRAMTKYSKQELVGKPHSIVRHPFMPESAFKDMWDTIKKGEHWSGLVMNLRKDGKHYWVEVHVDPVDEKGNNIYNQPDKIFAFVAVRREPTREEVRDAKELYKKMRIAELEEKKSLRDWEKELYEFLKSEKEF